MTHRTQTLDAPSCETDVLRVHRAVMAAAGPEALAELARPLTPAEQALLDQWLAETVGLTDAQLAARLRVPVDMARDIRRLLAGC